MRTDLKAFVMFSIEKLLCMFFIVPSSSLIWALSSMFCLYSGVITCEVLWTARSRAFLLVYLRSSSLMILSWCNLACCCASISMLLFPSFVWFNLCASFFSSSHCSRERLLRIASFWAVSFGAVRLMHEPTTLAWIILESVYSSVLTSFFPLLSGLWAWGLLISAFPCALRVPKYTVELSAVRIYL